MQSDCCVCHTVHQQGWQLHVSNFVLYVMVAAWLLYALHGTLRGQPSTDAGMRLFDKMVLCSAS